MKSRLFFFSCCAALMLLIFSFIPVSAQDNTTDGFRFDGTSRVEAPIELSSSRNLVYAELYVRPEMFPDSPQILLGASTLQISLNNSGRVTASIVALSDQPSPHETSDRDDQPYNRTFRVSSSPGSISAGQWHKIRVEWVSSVLTLFIDDIEIGSRPCQSQHGIYYTWRVRYGFGYRYGQGVRDETLWHRTWTRDNSPTVAIGNGFRGEIKEVHLWDSDFGGQWNLDEPQGSQTLVDASGRGQHGTFIQDPDQIAPVITLQGAADLTLRFSMDSYVESGATAVDNRDGEVTVFIQNEIGAAPGDYAVIYTATDAAGNTATATRTVQVVDTIPPSISLNGAAEVILEYGEGFTETVTADDNLVSEVPVTIEGSVGTDLGDYTLTYTATDAAGNTATATRTVRVVDTIPPVITLNGAAEVTLRYGNGFTETVTATDNVDGEVPVTIDGSVRTDPGDYTLTYTATDAFGNTATATRTVHVKQPVAATLPSGSYTVKGRNGYVLGNGHLFYATQDDPQTLRLEARADGKYSLRGPGQWIGYDWLMHTGPMDGSIVEKVFELQDLGDGRFALLQHDHIGGPYVYAKYSDAGHLSSSHDRINDWWIFTIQPTDPPANPDAAQYLAANPDLAAVFGNDHAAALNHYQQYGWAEGRPSTVPYLWEQLPNDYASDVTVSDDGTAYYVGTDGRAYGRTASGEGLDLGSSSVKHIDSSIDGEIWITKQDNSLWSFQANDWVHSPGDHALDVAVGPNGEVWYVGSDRSVYQRHMGQQPITGANRIDVGSDGSVWIVKEDTSIWRLTDGNWEQMPDVYGFDISIAADGTLYMVGTNGNVFVRFGRFETLSTTTDAKSIDVNANGTVFITKTDDTIWRTDSVQ